MRKRDREKERLERKIDDHEAFCMRLDAISKGRVPRYWVEIYLRARGEWWLKGRVKP